MGNKSHYDPTHKRVFVRRDQRRVQSHGRAQAPARATAGPEGPTRSPFSRGPRRSQALHGAGRRARADPAHPPRGVLRPGGKSQKHGHVNEAIFYILDGTALRDPRRDQVRLEAGDIAIVHNNCVHQHFNRSTDKPARALVIKTKPMYMFMNMLFQQRVTQRPSEPSPTQGDFKPREDADMNRPWYDDHDHDHDARPRHAHAHAHDQ